LISCKAQNHFPAIGNMVAKENPCKLPADAYKGGSSLVKAMLIYWEKS